MLSLNWADFATAKRGRDVEVDAGVGSTCKVAADLVLQDAEGRLWCLRGRWSSASKRRTRDATRGLHPVMVMVVTLMPGTAAGAGGWIGQPISVTVLAVVRGTAAIVATGPETETGRATEALRINGNGLGTGIGQGTDLGIGIWIDAEMLR